MKNPYKISWQNEIETAKAIGWREGYNAAFEDLDKEPEIPLDQQLLDFYRKHGYIIKE